MKYYETTTVLYNQRGEAKEGWISYKGTSLQDALKHYEDHSKDSYYEFFDEIKEYDVPDNFLELDEDEQTEIIIDMGGYDLVKIPDSDEYKTSPDEKLYRVYTLDINGREDELLITKDYWTAVECAEANKGVVEEADSWKRGWQYATVVKDFTEDDEDDEDDEEE